MCFALILIRSVLSLTFLIRSIQGETSFEHNSKYDEKFRMKLMKLVLTVDLIKGPCPVSQAPQALSHGDLHHSRLFRCYRASFDAKPST